MTEFIIRYHKYNQELGECEIKVPNDTASEFINHFKNLFEIELLQGQIQKESEKTLIKFQATRQKNYNFGKDNQNCIRHNCSA